MPRLMRNFLATFMPASRWSRRMNSANCNGRTPRPISRHGRNSGNSLPSKPMDTSNYRRRRRTQLPMPRRGRAPPLKRPRQPWSASNAKGESVEGGLHGASISFKEILRQAGWTNSDMAGAMLLAKVSELGGEPAFEEFLETMNHDRTRWEKRRHLALLRTI